METRKIFGRLTPAESSSNMQSYISDAYSEDTCLELCSGIIDANKEYIFEGDILKITGLDNQQTTTLIAPVVWVKEYACFAIVVDAIDPDTYRSHPYIITFKELFSPSFAAKACIPERDVTVIGRAKDNLEFQVLVNLWEKEFNRIRETIIENA